MSDIIFTGDENKVQYGAILFKDKILMCTEKWHWDFYTKWLECEE